MTHPPRPRRPWETDSAVGRLSLLTLAHVVGTMHIVSVMAMAPEIQADFALSATELGLLITAYYGGQTVGAVPAGALTDRLGVSRALVLALLLLSGGGLLVSVAGGLGGAMAGTALMGLGYTIVNPATAKGVLQWVATRRRATAMGIKQTGVPVGGMIAAGNGVLAAWVDWRVLLVAVGILGLAGSVAMLALGREVRVVSRGPHPYSPRSLLALARDRNVAAIFGSAIPWNMAHSNFLTFLTLFMRDAVRTTQPVAALALALGQGASIGGRIGWGVVSDTVMRGGRKRLLVLLCGGAGLLLLAMSLLQPGWVFPALALAVALGLTVASFQALQQTLTVESVASETAGSAMGLKVLGSSLGGMLGPPMFGWVVDVTSSYALAWAATGILMVAGTFLLAGWLSERTVALE